MASKKVLNIGDKINITKKTRDNAGQRQYVSQIQDFEDDDKIIISMPMEKSNFIPLKIGEKFESCFCTKGGLYKCRAEVIDAIRDGKQQVLLIQFMSELEKFQRREYFRLEYVSDMHFSRIVKEFDPIKGREVRNADEWVEATLTDISGGGLRFNSKIFYEGETEIFVKIVLGKEENEFECMCKANVVALTQVENTHDLYEYRVSFLDISTIDREGIVKFIFEEERRRRNKVDRS